MAVFTTAETAGEKAYRRIRTDIIFGRLTPGQKLKLDDLKEAYGVSVSTLREMLNRLTAEGLIVAENGSGNIFGFVLLAIQPNCETIFCPLARLSDFISQPFAHSLAQILSQHLKGAGMLVLLEKDLAFVHQAEFTRIVRTNGIYRPLMTPRAAPVSFEILLADDRRLGRRLARGALCLWW